MYNACVAGVAQLVACWKIDPLGVTIVFALENKYSSTGFEVMASPDTLGKTLGLIRKKSS